MSLLQEILRQIGCSRSCFVQDENFKILKLQKFHDHLIFGIFPAVTLRWTASGYFLRIGNSSDKP